MPNNEALKNRFMERYTKSVAAVKLFKASIDMLEKIKDELDKDKIVQDFLSTLFTYDVREEDVERVKQILNEYISEQMSHRQTLAYLNHLHDSTYSEASSMLLIQDIFKCYF